MSGCHCPLWRFLLALNPSRLSFLEIFDESRAYNAEFVGIHSNTVHSATWIIPTVASSDTSTGPHHSAPPVNCRLHLLMLAVFLQDWFRWTGRIPDGNKTRPGGWSTTEDARFDRWQAVSPSRLTQYLMFIRRDVEDEDAISYDSIPMSDFFSGLSCIASCSIVTRFERKWLFAARRFAWTEIGIKKVIVWVTWIWYLNIDRYPRESGTNLGLSFQRLYSDLSAAFRANFTTKYWQFV